MYILTQRVKVVRQLKFWPGKTNLENCKWNCLFSEIVSSLYDGGVIIELSFDVCSLLRMPPPPNNPLCINY